MWTRARWRWLPARANGRRVRPGRPDPHDDRHLGGQHSFHDVVHGVDEPTGSVEANQHHRVADGLGHGVRRYELASALPSAPVSDELDLERLRALGYAE